MPISYRAHIGCSVLVARADKGRQQQISKEHGEGCPGAAIEGLGAQVLERAPRPSSAELRKVMLLNTFTT